jgi:hypothetical protein
MLETFSLAEGVEAETQQGAPATQGKENQDAQSPVRRPAARLRKGGNVDARVGAGLFRNREGEFPQQKKAARKQAPLDWTPSREKSSREGGEKAERGRLVPTRNGLGGRCA